MSVFAIKNDIMCDKMILPRQSVQIRVGKSPEGSNSPLGSGDFHTLICKGLFIWAEVISVPEKTFRQVK